jgi:hypothetical protein
MRERIDHPSARRAATEGIGDDDGSSGGYYRLR